MESIGVSILVPSWKRVDYTKLLYKSVLKNSTWPENHQFLVHFNEVTLQDLEWAKTVGDETLTTQFDFLSSADNIGVSSACNRLAEMAAKNYVMPLDSDMYLLPGWDKAMAESIIDPDEQGLWRSLYVISSKGAYFANVHNFGKSIDEFREQKLLNWVQANKTKFASVISAGMPLVRVDDWKKIGGWGEEFFPGYCADPDFATKFYYQFHEGNPEHMFIVRGAVVYHFVGGSTSNYHATLEQRKQAHCIYTTKWKVSCKTFLEKTMKVGTRLEG